MGAAVLNGWIVIIRESTCTQHDRFRDGGDRACRSASVVRTLAEFGGWLRSEIPENMRHYTDRTHSFQGDATPWMRRHSQ